jgi:hypothetical protein
MKLRTKKLVIIGAVLLMLFAASCVAAPQNKVVGGVNKAISKSEETAVTPAPVQELTKETPSRIDTVIEGKSRSLTISADVVAPDMRDIYTAKIVPITADKTQMNKIVSIFFGDDTDKSVYDAGYEQYNLYSSAESSNSDAGSTPDKTFSGISYGRLEYYDFNLYASRYNETYYFGDKSNPQDLNCSMTQAQAIDALKKFYSQISSIVDMGALDINAVSSGNDNNTNLGSWEIDFSPRFFGIPFVPIYCLPSGGYSPMGKICVGDDGIISLYSRVMFSTTEKKKVDILSLDQVLSMIPDKLGTEIAISENDVIKQISLRYIVDWDNTQKQGDLVPVWFFSLEKLPTNTDTVFPSIPNYAKINTNSSSKTYFMMDAVTGEILG